jgi:hypothetical protein
MAPKSGPSRRPRPRVPAISVSEARAYIDEERKKRTASLSSLFKMLVINGFRWEDFPDKGKIEIARYAGKKYGLPCDSKEDEEGLISMFQEYCDSLPAGLDCDEFILIIMNAEHRGR